MRAGKRTFLLMSAALTLSCSQKLTNQAISVVPQRGGQPLVPTDPKYIDYKPSLSADGTTVVFLSGRDSVLDALTHTLKAYKASWPAGSKPGALSRVTSTELGVEQLAVVSPDGKWVAIAAQRAGSSTDATCKSGTCFFVYLQDVAGKAAPVLVPDTSAFKDQLAFSPDSKLLSWISGDGTEANATAMVVAIGDGTAADVASPVTIAAAKQVQQLFWQQVGSGYQLVVGVISASNGGLAGTNALDYSKYAFSTAPAAATAAATASVADAAVDLTVQPVAATNSVLVARIPAASEGLANIGRAPVLSAPAFFGTDNKLYSYTATDNPVPAPRNQLGYQLVAANLSTDGADAYLLERLGYTCAVDQNQYNTDIYNFGPMFLTMPTVGTGANVGTTPLAKYVPRLKATDVQPGQPRPFDFDLATDYCQRSVAPDGIVQHIDDRVEDFKVAANATATTYRAAYVTRLSLYFDGTCALKSADQEVMLMDISPAAQTIYYLSQNRPDPTAPVPDISKPHYSDDDRGGYDACVL